MKLKNFKGTRDYFYKDYKNRERILSIIKEKFEVCGFTGLDTPAIEYIENLYPEGKLIYCLAYKGGNEAALRYDLTVPMARFVSQHFHTLRFPFKRYQIQKVWRADSPQFGRYREFYQCDADIVVHKTSDPTEIKSSNISTVRELGVNISSHEESKYIDENLYDVIEILRMASKILSSLNMGNFKIAINNRKLMDFISIKILRIPEEKIPSFYILLDKKNKLEKSEFDKELQPYLSYLQIDCEEFYKIFKHIQQEMLDSIISSINQVELNFEPKKFFKLIESIINDDQSFGDSEQKEILELMINFSNLFKIGDPMKMKEISNIDLFLVRGLNYYTSWIYEGSFDEEPNLSVCAGGTYSDLFKVPNVELEGIGISFGLDRIFSIFKKQEEKKQKQERKSPLVKVLFCASRVEVNFWPRNFDSIQIIGGLLWQLRERNISADVYYKRMLISKQIQYAAENHIPVVVYITKWDTNIDFTDLLWVEVLERWERTIKVMVRFLSYRADIPAKKEEIPLDQLVNRLEEFFRNWNEDEYFGNKK